VLRLSLNIADVQCAQPACTNELGWGLWDFTCSC